MPAGRPCSPPEAARRRLSEAPNTVTIAGRMLQRYIHNGAASATSRAQVLDLTALGTFPCRGRAGEGSPQQGASERGPSECGAEERPRGSSARQRGREESLGGRAERPAHPGAREASEPPCSSSTVRQLFFLFCFFFVVFFFLFCNFLWVFFCFFLQLIFPRKKAKGDVSFQSFFLF